MTLHRCVRFARLDSNSTLVKKGSRVRRQESIRVGYGCDNASLHTRLDMSKQIICRACRNTTPGTNRRQPFQQPSARLPTDKRRNVSRCGRSLSDAGQSGETSPLLHLMHTTATTCPSTQCLQLVILSCGFPHPLGYFCMPLQIKRIARL